MQAHQPEVLKPSEKRWSKCQLEFEPRVHVIPRGLVAARVLAFQAAPSNTWSMFSTPKLAQSSEFEALVKRKANYKSPRNPCKPLPSVTQPLSSDHHQSSNIPSIGKPVPVSERGNGGSVINSNLGEVVELEEELRSHRDDVRDDCVDEVGEILDGAMDYQSQDGGDSKRGPEIKIAPSICLSAMGGDLRLPEEKQPQLNMPLTETSSLGGDVGKSIIPLGSSHQPPISTSLDASIQSKKSERKEQPTPGDSHDITRAIGPQIASHSLLYSNGSAAQSQQALTLGPSDPTVLEIKDAIELHYLSPAQAASSSTGESTNAFVHRNVARNLSFKEANPLGSTTPTRKVRHFMSTTSLRTPSQLSKTQSTLKRWNWWKLGGRKQRTTGGISGDGRENCINAARQRDPQIPLESFHTQPIRNDAGTTGQESDEEPANADDPTSTSKISKEPETSIGSRGFKGKGITDTSPRNNEIQSRSYVELPLAMSPPELDRRLSPDLCVSPSLADDTLSQERFSDTASTIRLQPDKSNRAVRWRNRGQNFQRVQLIVNLDLRELVVKAKVENKGKGKLG